MIGPESLEVGRGVLGCSMDSISQTRQAQLRDFVHGGGQLSLFCSSDFRAEDRAVRMVIVATTAYGMIGL
jgi:hypothetical protein